MRLPRGTGSVEDDGPELEQPVAMTVIKKRTRRVIVRMTGVCHWLQSPK
jgi:hypothetical protein